MNISLYFSMDYTCNILYEIQATFIVWDLVVAIVKDRKLADTLILYTVIKNVRHMKYK